jgi:DNA-binding MarR family transcriptional regulator
MFRKAEYVNDIATGLPEASLESLLLRVTKRCWSAVFSSALRRSLPGHVTPQQLFVLAHLCHRPSQPSTLAREQHVGMSAMTGLVDGLVARGLVERGQDPHDRRAVQLAITDDGRALWGEAQAAVLDVARQFLLPLSPEERERLALALTDLERALESSEGCGERAAASEDAEAAVGAAPR